MLAILLFFGQKLQETSGNVEELKEELAELEPELKATQEEGQRLTHALAQQRTQVSNIRDEMVALEERVKVRTMIQPAIMASCDVVRSSGVHCLLELTSHISTISSQLCFFHVIFQTGS